MTVTASLARLIGQKIPLAVVLCGASIFVASLRGAPQAPAQTQPTLCMDEQGAKYSQNAMRKVVDQIQSCAAGMWIFAPSMPPKDPPPADAKSCLSTRTADKGQEYAAGLLRTYDDSSTHKPIVERCDNGFWKKVPGNPKH
jgi:hypothetical protein